ncbi:MAG TPA: LLM class flavin-dependent oxidoreductase [Chloroflexota bacterium]
MPAIGFQVPAMAPDSTALSCVQFAQHAEALGAHSVWVPDRLLYRSPEALVTLAAIAAETSRVRLGINVRLGVSRPPVLLAKTLATLDVLSGGRLIVGLGVGSRSDDFAASHVPLRQRGRPVVILSPSASLRTSSAKDPRAGAVSAKRIPSLRSRTGSSQAQDDNRTALGEQPLQEPHPPLWFGGGADAVLQRTARPGDGWIASTSTGLSGFTPRWTAIQHYAMELGRDPATITPAALMHFSIDTDADRALLILSPITAEPSRLDLFAKTVIPRLPLTPL